MNTEINENFTFGGNKPVIQILNISKISYADWLNVFFSKQAGKIYTNCATFSQTDGNPGGVDRPPGLLLSFMLFRVGFTFTHLILVKPLVEMCFAYSDAVTIGIWQHCLTAYAFGPYQHDSMNFCNGIDHNLRCQSTDDINKDRRVLGASSRSILPFLRF